MRMIRDASQAYSRFARRLSGALPKGLFARSLIIIIAPIILLQAVVAAVFLERHWAQVTERLSESFVNDVRGLIAIYDTVQPREAARALVVSNGELLGYAAVDFEAGAALPAPLPPPSLDLLYRVLMGLLTKDMSRPFWLDTISSDSVMELRVQLDGEVLTIRAWRGLATVRNWHIFLVWMVISSIVLIGIAVVFLRNQIRPILSLADAADEFGKGREVDYKPRGAREVRRAGWPFLR